jgi:hypothetical protein
VVEEYAKELKQMSHINFKMTGTNCYSRSITKSSEGTSILREVGYSDIQSFKECHPVDTPGYVDDTGIMEKLEDKLTNSLVSCNEYYITAENASYHKLEIDTPSDDLMTELKSIIDATASWNILNVSCITDAEFDSSNNEQAPMTCCGNCASGTELVAVTLACRS